MCAFSLGLALSSRAGGSKIAAAERMYRLSIETYPDFADVYLNLGTLLLFHGGAHTEVESLFGHYLLLSPNGPEANAVRRALVQLATARPGRVELGAHRRGCVKLDPSAHPAQARRDARASSSASPASRRARSFGELLGALPEPTPEVTGTAGVRKQRKGAR